MSESSKSSARFIVPYLLENFTFSSIVDFGCGDGQFIEEFNAGVILNGEQNNLVENASKLNEIISDPETPRRCRALAEKYFSMDVGASRYLDLYSQIKNA